MLRTWEEMRTNPPANCTAAPRSEDNLFVWDASIFGPSGWLIRLILKKHNKSGMHISLRIYILLYCCFITRRKIVPSSDSPYEGGIFHLIMEFEPSIRSASSRPPKVRNCSIKQLIKCTLLKGAFHDSNFPSERWPPR